MNVMEAIQTRRSVRKYTDRPVEKETLDQILEAARLSPSATNGQNWRFIAVTDQAVLQKLYAASFEQPFVAEAPCAIVACATANRVMACGQPTATVDVSIAMSYMILAAHELGLGTCWLGRFQADLVREAIGAPEDVTVVALTPLGYPGEETMARPRKAFDEVVGYDQY